MTLKEARHWARTIRDTRGYFVLVGRATPDGQVVITCTRPDGSTRILTTEAEVNAVLLRGL